MGNQNAITILVLAAGESSRMGQSKQLLKIDGQTLLARTIDASVQSNADRVVVVLGANAETHQKELDNTPAEVVINEKWKSGMGSSIKAGLRHITSTQPATGAVIIVVCDQPHLSSDILNGLIDAYRSKKAKVVAARYAGTLGVPALFDAGLFPTLAQLSDADGAKKIIQAQSQPESIDFEDGKIDIDTMEDYREVTKGDIA